MNHLRQGWTRVPASSMTLVELLIATVVEASASGSFSADAWWEVGAHVGAGKLDAGATEDSRIGVDPDKFLSG